MASNTPARRVSFGRIARHFCGSLVFGVLLTIASAAMLAVNATGLKTTSRDRIDAFKDAGQLYDWEVNRSSSFGVLQWQSTTPGRSGFGIFGAGGQLLKKHGYPTVETPDWLEDLLAARERELEALHDTPNHRQPRQVRWQEHYLDEFAGWPMLAFHSEVRTTVDRNSKQRVVDRVRGGFTLSRRPFASTHKKLLSIPLRPVWIGFTVNTALYGTAVCVVLTAARISWRNRYALFGPAGRRFAYHIAFIAGMGALATYCCAALLIVAGAELELTGRRNDHLSSADRGDRLTVRTSLEQACGLERWNSSYDLGETYVNYFKFVPPLDDDDLPEWLAEILPNREGDFRARAAAVSAAHSSTADEYTYFFGSYADSFAGWPMLALRAETFTGFGAGTIGDSREVRWGLSIPQGSNDRSREKRLDVIPLRPVWPGFFVNAVLYGSAAWLVLVLPWVLNRALRRRRNSCVHCGYDRHGLESTTLCPECGSENRVSRTGRVSPE